MLTRKSYREPPKRVARGLLYRISPQRNRGPRSGIGSVVAGRERQGAPMNGKSPKNEKQRGPAAPPVKPTSESTAALLRELVAHLRAEPHPAARGMGAPHHGIAAPHRHDPRGDLRRGDLGLRQLRRGARDGQRRSAPGLCAQPLRAHHPAGRRDPRGARHRAAASRRARPLPVQEVPGRLRPAEQRARRLRAGRQPHRQHGGGRLRPGARAHHPPAAGGDPRALDAGACRCATGC